MAFRWTLGYLRCYLSILYSWGQNCSCASVLPSRGLHTFSKGQMIKSLGFLGHEFSVTTIHFCCYSVKATMLAKSLQSCPILCDPVDCSPPRLLCPWDSPGKNTEVRCHALLQGIFLTQGSNPCLLRLLHWEVSSLPLVPPGKPIDNI